MLFNAAEGIRGSARQLILETETGKCCAGPSVVARSRSEDQPFQLPDGASAQPQSRLEALLAKLAGVEAPAQLVERRPVLLVHLVASGLDQDQVARTAMGGGHADEPLALLGIEPLGREHDGLAGLEPLQHRLLE